MSLSSWHYTVGWTRCDVGLNQLRAENWQVKTEVLLESCLSATVSTKSHVRITMGLNPRLRYVWLGQRSCFSNRYVVAQLFRTMPIQTATSCHCPSGMGWDVCVSTNGWILHWSYRSLNAILAQLKNCHLELLRLSCKTERLHPTIQAHWSPKHPARCHYCRM